ncbi:MAG TPA: xanthine dehydrogenase family protein molybdopterin-binding subunit [Burkholderiales bacterium]|nr:xanthine dehydrogenase family protein molybdopterin-binding subunit [Burkholderiales bacterium]
MTQPFRGRREDRRLVTGQGRFTGDWNLPGQVYGHFLRSDRAHAEIVSLDVEAARASPGVKIVFTGDDVRKAGFKPAPPLVRYPGRGGMKMLEPHRDALAVGRVRHVGQEVALVVAESPAAAQDAAERIAIEYRELPVIVDADAALAPGAPQLYDDIPGNLAFDFEYGDEVKVEAAFARAAHVTRVTLESQRLVGNPMEPKACLAAYDAAIDTFDLYAPSQGMTLMLGSLSAIIGHPPQKIRLHARDVGGGFGVRSEAYAEYCAVMLAARTLGKPVKWVGSRAETFVSDHHGRAAKLVGELALDRDGTFLALRLQWIVNAGAYLSHPGPLINTLLPGFHATNLYRIPALYGRHRLALTNTTPTTAYRGAGRPNVAYIAERLVEEAARELGVDRIELRRRNMLRKDEFPYQTPLPMSKYDSGDPHGHVDMVLEKADWKGFEARRAEAKARGRLRGIGCAVFVEPAGAGGSPKEEAEIRFGSSGNAELFTVSGSSGQGHETVYPEVAAEILGIDPERITLRASDPDGPPLMGDGTIGSRSMMAQGGAVAMAVREAVRKGTDLAAKALEVGATDIEFADGSYRVKGTDLTIRFEEVVRRYAGQSPHPLDARGDLPQPRSFPGGAHVAEVEIDPETGEVKLLRYTAVDDCGRVINHTLLDGQLHGGIVQGIGQALGEHALYDPATGQLMSGTFLDYTMPRADEQPEIHLYDNSVPAPGNPLGVKGAGEAGTTGAVPTIANAVIDALRPLGINHLDFPFSPARVWAAIAGATADRRPGA